MNQGNEQKYIRVRKITLVVAILILGAGFLGWRLGDSNKTTPTQPGSMNQPSTGNNANATAVKSLVSYTLPDGWNETSCSAAPGTVYVLPNGSAGPDCSANPSSPVKISVDPGHSTDCNQLQNVQDVKKHVCISLYINGHKSLKASTEYLPSSSYKQDTTINAYYIDTGNGVIKVAYVYSSDNQFQMAFDQLANSIKVKS